MKKISSQKKGQYLCNVVKQTGYKNVNTQCNHDPNSLQIHFPDAKLEKKNISNAIYQWLSLSCRLQLFYIFQVSYNKLLVL